MSFSVFSSSAMRDWASCSCLPLVTAASAAPAPLPAPGSRDTRSWSLPGRAAGVFSWTAVPIWPAAARPPVPSAIGAAAASRSRYARQSDACTRTVFAASLAGVAAASSADGTVRIAPVRSRFMLLPSNASAFDLNSATSICSSDTDVGLVSPAIFDSVSPRLTV